ncbi:MAG: hypothetical protein H6R25_1791 [Proteobacteria bacterium]|nr:hypothetical protein [Pseudomonadota bacterium]
MKKILQQWLERLAPVLPVQVEEGNMILVAMWR